MIKRKGGKFYLEVFLPKQDWKLLGMIIVINIPDECQAFSTHVKKPENHFFIKGQGYPINEELLKMLKNAHIEYIIIPEDGKTGWNVYLGETEKYLKGDLIQEPRTESQRVVPLNSLSKIDLNREQLRKYMYW